MVRVPLARGAGTRVENRLPEAATNPYVAAAGLIATGVLGLDEGASGADVHRRQRLPARLPSLPASLAHALEALEADPDLRRILGERSCGCTSRSSATSYGDSRARHRLGTPSTSSSPSVDLRGEIVVDHHTHPLADRPIEDRHFHPFGSDPSQLTGLELLQCLSLGASSRTSSARTGTR